MPDPIKEDPRKDEEEVVVVDPGTETPDENQDEEVHDQEEEKP